MEKQTELDAGGRVGPNHQSRTRAMVRGTREEPHGGSRRGESLRLCFAAAKSGGADRRRRIARSIGRREITADPTYERARFGRGGLGRSNSTSALAAAP